MVRWLVALVFVAGCPGRAHVHKPGEVWLGEIKLVGNKAIPDDDLIPGLALDRARRDGRAADPYQLTVDGQRIKNAYLKLGYFDVKVDSKIDREDNQEIAVFTVVEGPRVKSLVSFRGLPPEVPEAKARELVELRDGAPFDYEQYDDGKDALKILVEEAGYPHVLLYAAVTVDKGRGLAVASYDIEPGERATFGDTTIVGVDAAPDLKAAIVGRLAYKKGDLYTPRATAATTRALFELGRFASVVINPDRSKGAVVPVTIAVALGEGTEVKAGGGIGYEPLSYEARLRGGFSYIPADYPLWTIFGDGRLALTKLKDLPYSFDNLEPKVRILVTAQRFDFLRPRLTGEIGAGFDFVTVEAYTSTGPVLRLAASSPLGVRWLTFAASWVFQYVAFSGFNEFLAGPSDPTVPDGNARTRALLGLRSTERLGKYEQNIVADLRDDPLGPHRGAYLGLRVSEGTLLAGGAFNYLELQPDLRGYYSLGRVVVAARVRGGAIIGDVPITERFFAGGAQSQRGFSERQLAPSATGVKDGIIGGPVGSVLIGGSTFIETGVELRIPLRGDFGTTLFLDGGDVPVNGIAIDPFHLHWAAGAGISYKLGGFKLRLDLGFRLNRTGPTEPQYETGTLSNAALHLGVGETY